MGLNKLRYENPNDNLCQKMGRRKLRSEAVWVRGLGARAGCADLRSACHGHRAALRWNGAQKLLSKQGLVLLRWVAVVNSEDMRAGGPRTQGRPLAKCDRPGKKWTLQKPWPRRWWKSWRLEWTDDNADNDRTIREGIPIDLANLANSTRERWD